MYMMNNNLEQFRQGEDYDAGETEEDAEGRTRASDYNMRVQSTLL